MPPVTGSVLVVDGKVALVGQVPASAVPRHALRVDVHRLAVSPGFINIHSHSDVQVLTHPEAKTLVMQGITTETIGNCGGSSVDTSKWDESTWRQILSGTSLKHRWDGVRGYLAAVNEVGPAVNVAAMFGHGDIRRRIVGDDGRPMTPTERKQAEEMARVYMAEGAFGVTSGLEYVPGRFASVEELAAVSRPVAAAGGIHASHIRNEGPELIEFIQECIAVSRLSGVRFEVSHIKACGPENWGKVKAALAMLDKQSEDAKVSRCADGAGGSGGIHDAGSNTDSVYYDASSSSDSVYAGEMTADFYPYLASSTELAIVLPDWALEKGKKVALETLKDPGIRRKAELESHRRTELQGGWDRIVISGVNREQNKWMEGLNVAEIAGRMGKEPPVVALDILMDEAMQVRIARFAISEEDLVTALRHPKTCVVTDGNNAVPEEGTPHPRSVGTFPRVLGHYARERGVISMEEAVRKMTSLPSQRLGIPDRGLVAPGFWADLVVFDRDRIIDRATYDNPWQYPDGIFAVFVNGEPVVWQGEPTGARPGMALRPEVR
jgi:N-acyl-D-amino-acid deacylase